MLNAVDALNWQFIQLSVLAERLGTLFAPVAAGHLDPEKCGLLNPQGLDVLHIGDTRHIIKGHLFY
jgi:hypothetical protein